MSVQIKNNEADNSTELWVDGEFQTSWLIFEIPEPIRGRIVSMMNRCVSVGEQKKQTEIKKVLGVRL